MEKRQTTKRNSSKPYTQEDMIAFGRRVHAAMTRRGFVYQTDLARAAGLEKNRISAYINGKSIPSPGHLQALADALKVRTDFLWPFAVSDASDFDDYERESDQSLYSMAVSPDGKQMRLTADIWVPSAVGAQLIQILTEHATAHRE